jgi:hypothetical protein
MLAAMKYSVMTDIPRAQLIQLLGNFGHLAASRALMEWLGVLVGPPRLPNSRLASSRLRALRTALGQIGFFDLSRFARGAVGGPSAPPASSTRPARAASGIASEKPHLYVAAVSLIPSA